MKATLYCLRRYLNLKFITFRNTLLNILLHILHARVSYKDPVDDDFNITRFSALIQLTKSLYNRMAKVGPLITG